MELPLEVEQGFVLWSSSGVGYRPGSVVHESHLDRPQLPKLAIPCRKMSPNKPY
ncbi:hypothetical protein BSY18_4052 (plasmid) [Blastomonas sp. RAC04]|nr:hypothetical protein BSY18_4052 [Blastomonas sp. RAC04]